MLTGSATTGCLQNLTRNEAYNRMKKDLNELLRLCPQHERLHYVEETEGFLKMFQKYLTLSESKLVWNEIELPSTNFMLDYDYFPIPRRNKMKVLLDKLVIVKLNGGLGTSMKLEGPKSLIPVRNKLTFLDLTIQQIVNLNVEFDTNVPLVLMNSYNTNAETEQALQKYHNFRVQVYTFMQKRYPRIHAETLTLLPSSYNDEDVSSWYPPGHGDFYESFHKSGLLNDFILDGKRFCFVSNIDNLGAVVDLKILHLMESSEMIPEYLMEVTRKTEADVKGGTLIHYRGKMRLLELSQVPKDQVDDFKCTDKFNNFNTNNIWIRLDAIENMVKEDKLFWDVIVNKKQICRNSSKMEVLQLETAAGAAIEAFDQAMGILVPRSRFLPVKSTTDLFLLRSNVYINDNGIISMNPQRPFTGAPLINFSDEYFGSYRDLETRFETIPDCLHLHHLTLSGDVHFAADVVLKGNVTIIASYGERIDIPQGAVLRYKIVTGCLRIVDF